MDTLLDLLNKFEALGSREALIGFNDFRTSRLTYRETYEAIGRFAALLDSKGLRKGDRVLIWGENRPEWVIAFWGCVARGIAIVPVDYRFSTELVLRIYRESKPRLVLYGYSVDATQIPIRAVSFSEIRKLPPAPALRTTPIDPDDIVEIVYTSGTTAEPKGVVHRHRNMAANLEPFRKEIEKYLRWGRPFQPIRVLDLLPLSHMFGQALGLFIPVLLGGSVGFTEELNPAAIIKSVKRQRISVLASVPHVIDNLRKEIERQFELPPDPAGTGLKGMARRWWRYRRVHSAFGWKFWCVVSGGAFVAPDLEGFWHRLGFVFVQGYGLTETSSVIAVNHPFRARRGSIGKAIRGQEIRIAADGEILVRGESVVGAVDPEGWFHTGDVGEMDQEGQLYFKGRKKDVIVTADGMNVYPEDVETVLNELPQVRASVVVSEDDHVHAALILRESAASVKSIIDQANRRLEPYQQIRGWSLWPAEDFPRTASTLKVRRGEVARLIARGALPETEAKELPDDLAALSSLERVDLLASLEQRYGVELNEESFSQITTTEELQAWVEEQTAISVPPTKELSTPWAANRVVRFFGDGLQRAIALPLFRHYIPLEVRGLENLRGLRHPVIFASNHTSHLDTPAIFAALPVFWRKRLAPAARQEQFRAVFDQEAATWKEFFNAMAQYRLAGLFFNVYPLPQQMSGVRRALRTTGELVNRGFCPLIFPEGIRTSDGKMHCFQPGVGLMALRLRVPVVPVFVHGLYDVYSVHDSWPKPGPVSVTFGRALEFTGDVGYAEAAARVEEAVRSLATAARSAA